MPQQAAPKEVVPPPPPPQPKPVAKPEPKPEPKVNEADIALQQEKKRKELLADSNLDWGQGLLELRDFLDANHVDRVSLAYAGRVRPELYGIRYDNLGAGTPTQNVVAISANLLWGRAYFVNGTSHWPGSDDYAFWRAREPWAVLGHTIYVYRLR